MHRKLLAGLALTVVFFAASAEDEPFETDARAMYAASGSPDRVLEILAGAAHGSRMLEDPAFRARVEAFIAAHEIHSSRWRRCFRPSVTFGA